MNYPMFLIANLRFWEHRYIFPWGEYEEKPFHGWYFLDMLETAIERLECAIMTKKQVQQRRNFDNSKIEFVNINLSKKERDQFKAWYTELETEIPRLIAVFMSQGYKIGIRYDTENECYICSATCFDDSMENHGKCLTSRSADWLEAMALNLFKTDVMSPDGIWESTTSGSNWG